MVSKDRSVSQLLTKRKEPLSAELLALLCYLIPDLF